ncbi:crotonase/enoyl-CoA hydratase family protein [Novosphingobium sp. G106]|uniref:crotonase/enoyl-CoA hydratase family protein n=1 Tax=Novosphingobium sp. G106 TaxID=2849500 RepID=UPI0028120151|nr:crotonase/enoyl-CoA hydratase family protein [Novosphingobium sp. G106]
MPAIPLRDGVEHLLEESNQRLAVPERLLNLDELDVLYDERNQSLWSFMRPKDRPSFTPTLLADFEQWQGLIKQSFGPDRVPLRYLVLGSRAPGVFCFGGDLALFHGLIRERNREGLAAYGYRCVEILNRNMHALDLPLLTIGLVQGQALGGGFEALLSFDFIIAERGSTFGLPEVTFGLFPGMGAHAILSRKLGAAMADRIILSNETYTAEDMYDLGIVHQIAPAGEGVAAVREFMAKSDRRHAGLVNARRAMRAATPIAMSEYYEIVDLWADAALQLREQDLKLMQRLAGAQARQAQLAKAS